MRRKSRRGRGRAFDGWSAEYVRAIFREYGLAYGRCVGSKHAYVRRNPGAFFLANACVVTRDGQCVWRGDLDFSSKQEVGALALVSRRLNRVLFVFREHAAERVPAGTWLTENAVLRVWRGAAATTGTTARMYGSLSEIVSRRRRRSGG